MDIYFHSSGIYQSGRESRRPGFHRTLHHWIDKQTNQAKNTLSSLREESGSPGLVNGLWPPGIMLLLWQNAVSLCISLQRCNGVMSLHLTLTPSLPSQRKTSLSEKLLFSSDAQAFETCFFCAEFGVWLDKRWTFDLKGRLVPLTQDPVFSSVTGVDAFLLIWILFAGGTSVFDCDNSFTCDLVLFGILASKSDRHTLVG